MTSTTEKLLNELNAALGLSYPQIGYSFYQDVVGNGIAKPRIYTIVNAFGGVTYSEMNDANPRKRCGNIREAIKRAPRKKAVNKLVTDLTDCATRMNNDVYGNPRYYMPAYMFPAMPDKIRSRAGLQLYRGKQYGRGYVLQAYSLPHELRHVANTIVDFLETQEG